MTLMCALAHLFFEHVFSISVSNHFPALSKNWCLTKFFFLSQIASPFLPVFSLALMWTHNSAYSLLPTFSFYTHFFSCQRSVMRIKICSHMYLYKIRCFRRMHKYHLIALCCWFDTKWHLEQQNCWLNEKRTNKRLSNDKMGVIDKEWVEGTHTHTYTHSNTHEKT